MKKLLAAVMLVAFAGTSAFAADTTYKSSIGDVAFPAGVHKDVKAPAKFASKDEAHKFCKGCHETKQKGPTKCGQCHKKK